MEALDVIVDILFVSILVYAALRILNGLLTTLNEAKDQELQEFKDRLSKITHKVSVEKHGEMLYWFDADTDLFLGQGATDTDIVSIVQKRFPTHMFIMPDDSVIAAKTEWIPKQFKDIEQFKKLLQHEPSKAR